MSGTGIFNGGRLVELGLEELDRSDRTFALSWPAERDLEPLARSIDASGMLQPLWVVVGAEVGWCLVDGFRRLAAARTAGLGKVPALVLALSRENPALFRARLAATGERLSAVEKFRAVEKAQTLFGLNRVQLAGTILPLLGLGSSKKMLDELLLLRNLEDPVARFCADNAVALREAALWADFPREGQRALLVLVRALTPGQNLLRNYLQLVKEISLREAQTVQEVLQDGEIRAVLLDPEQARSGGRETVHRILRRKRYPLLDNIEKTFDTARRKLTLPEGVAVEPPAAFEGDTVSVSFKAGSPAELLEKAQALAEAAKSGNAGALFEALGAPPDKTGAGA